MKVGVRSFAKINIGLAIGPRRQDGFHALHTVYQTIGLHDRLQVSVAPRSRGGPLVVITCNDPRVPTGESNTCWRMAIDVMRAFGRSDNVTINIDKRLPLQGGLGASSSNAAATMVALEHLLHKKLDARDRLAIAANVGSDVPLFLLGGTVMGLDRGQQVFPVPALANMSCVVVFAECGISTPRAFSDWDDAAPRPNNDDPAPRKRGKSGKKSKLTRKLGSDRMEFFSRGIASWLSGSPTGVSASSRNRAEAQLLDLVRTGIANDFEQVVFPQHPELARVKSVLQQSGASYTSLSGSGSSIYGLFSAREPAIQAAARLKHRGLNARITSFLPAQEYHRRMLIAAASR